jgi:hypothetical protein
MPEQSYRLARGEEVVSSSGDKPVNLTIERPAAMNRDPIAYSEVLGRESRQSISGLARLVALMLATFVASARAFAGSRRNAHSASSEPSRTVEG